MDALYMHGLGLKTQAQRLVTNNGVLLKRRHVGRSIRVKSRGRRANHGYGELGIVAELFEENEGMSGGGGTTKEICDKNEATRRRRSGSSSSSSRMAKKDEEEEEEGGRRGKSKEMMVNGKKSSGNNGAIMNGGAGAMATTTSSSMKVLTKPASGGRSEIRGGDYVGLMRQLLPTNYQQQQEAAEAEEEEEEGEGGLGIVHFLRAKNLFITGATGFLAKVLVEKILRVQPDVGQLFLLIKAKDLKEAKKRLREEIMHSHLFKKIQTQYGESYKQYMEAKLIPVVGNIAKDNLGMDAQTIADLKNKLDLIVNSAASTTFDERYDHAINLNTRGAQRVVDFALSCPKLQLFMHVSTAFVNGERKGIVHEKTFKIGCSIANEGNVNDGKTTPDIDVDIESRLIQEKISHILKKNQSNKRFLETSLGCQQDEKLLQQAMKELGMERAKAYGWQDTYVFTKAMGEMLIDSRRGQLPVVIVRPSVVESSFKDPYPGWMEGNRMMDPIIISYGKGQLPGFLVDPKSVLDVVPVDMVANAMLAAMTRHANKKALEVYQVASSVVNPLFFSELARMSKEHFLQHPFVDSMGKPIRAPDLELFQDMETFMQAITSSSKPKKDAMLSTSNTKSLLDRQSQLTLKVKQQVVYLANLYRPYTFYAGRFDTSKTQELYGSLSYQEKQLFGFDLTEIDWDTYIKTIHIPGLKKHVLKGRGSTMSQPC